jgi:hypothetical protein
MEPPVIVDPLSVPVKTPVVAVTVVNEPVVAANELAV